MFVCVVLLPYCGGRGTTAARNIFTFSLHATEQKVKQLYPYPLSSKLLTFLFVDEEKTVEQTEETMLNMLGRSTGFSLRAPCNASEGRSPNPPSGGPHHGPAHRQQRGREGAPKTTATETDDDDSLHSQKFYPRGSNLCIRPLAAPRKDRGKGSEWGCQSRLARGCMPEDEAQRGEEGRHREEVAPRNPFRRSNASGRPSKSSRPSFRPRPSVQAARDFGSRGAEPRDGSGGHCIAGPTWSPPRV